MYRCACKPGTYENGWIESRCEACLEAEIRAFSRAIERAAATRRAIKKQRDER